MNTKFKKLFPWVILLLILTVGAAITHQVIGPSTATTTHALARWTDTSGWKTTNSVVTVDDSGDMSGLSIITTPEIDGTTAYLTNGFIFLQKSSAPTAAFIGGNAGTLTNYMIINL